MEADSVLVTGANRGIGLELVRQLVDLPKPPRLVFATYRNRDTVQKLKDIRDATKNTQVILIKMDVTIAEELENAAKIVDDMVGEKGLTLLINNAGAAHRTPFPEATDETFLFNFTINTLGPIKVLKAMLPLLQRSADFHRNLDVGVSRAAVLNVSSAGGSIATTEYPNPGFNAHIGYRTSKAALNMAMRIIAFQYKDQGILVVQMCPGWVKTDLGTDRGLLEVEDSVASILNTLPTLDESHNGAFINNKGEPIPF
ncbi:hypothetical protein JTE90_001752 [Oedothorax gibbosus]|uniref:Uncharacterized protein n=1 Tax=Oedothorax gibbosus TaxID=931172 RepID=A0AAV6V5X4_9ARAC|nr:hypothetical protein JTE90_001752 [Oedothorax gibbosus]